MNSMQRVLTALSHKEPDRVPLFLLTALQGAKELGLSIEDYFSRADYVVDSQMRLLKKYRSDCLYPFFYVAIEMEAWGGGFILADNHGEIPWQVPDEMLLAIGDAVERWGRYPLDWIE